MIELVSTNDSDNYEYEKSTCTTARDLMNSLNETISIVSDSTESSTVDCSIIHGENIPRQDLSNNNISITRSAEILIGSRTQINGTVVIKNFNAGNESQNSIVLDPEPYKLDTPVEKETSRNWFLTLRTYIPCKSKRFVILFIMLKSLSVVSVLCGVAIAAYLLYLHFDTDYTEAGVIFVCKTIDTAVCYIGSDSTSCSNLISSDSRPYISGHTTSEFDICKIYSKKNCQGDLQEIGSDHISFFFDALSVRC